MANQHPQKARPGSPTTAESVTQNLESVQNQLDGQSRESQDWRSFSKDIEFLAICLRGLAHPAKCSSMKAVHYYISQLIELTRRLAPLLTEYGLIFVAVRPVNDFV